MVSKDKGEKKEGAGAACTIYSMSLTEVLSLPSSDAEDPLESTFSSWPTFIQREGNLTKTFVFLIVVPLLQSLKKNGKKRLQREG